VQTQSHISHTLDHLVLNQDQVFVDCITFTLKFTFRRMLDGFCRCWGKDALFKHNITNDIAVDNVRRMNELETTLPPSQILDAR
jgi:hypothetical protein